MSRQGPDPRHMASSAVMGEALVAARRPEVEQLAADLAATITRQTARLPDQTAALRAENAGILAGAWYASPGSHIGYELIASGLLLICGEIDYDEVARWSRVGYDRTAGGRGPWNIPDHARGNAGEQRI